jgi:hypothetical protein
MTMIMKINHTLVKGVILRELVPPSHLDILELLTELAIHLPEVQCLEVDECRSDPSSVKEYLVQTSSTGGVGIRLGMELTDSSQEPVVRREPYVSLQLCLSLHVDLMRRVVMESTHDEIVSGTVPELIRREDDLAIPDGGWLAVMCGHVPVRLITNHPESKSVQHLALFLLRGTRLHDRHEVQVQVD